MHNHAAMMISQLTDAYVGACSRVSQGSSTSLDSSLKCIACEAFPRMNTAAAKLSRIRAGLVPVNAKLAKAVLDACRSELASVASSAGLPASAVQGLEQEIARSLHLPGDRPTVDDIMSDTPRLDHRLYEARSVEELGFDDLVEWNPTRPWHNANTPTVRRRALVCLGQLRAAASTATTDERRLEYAQMAIALAMHFISGSEQHDCVYDLANEVVSVCGLNRLSESRVVDPQVRDKALRLRMQMRWVRVAPHGSSPTNYWNCLLRGERLIGAVADQIAEPMIDIDRLTRERIRLACNRTRVNRTGVIFSFQARLLLLTGNAADRRRARHLHREAMEHVADDKGCYCHQFPILLALSQGDVKRAVRLCETLVPRFRDQGLAAAEAGYAALLMQLSGIGGVTPTTDDGIRTLARSAVQSPQLRYMFSHLFTPTAVERMLSGSEHHDRPAARS